MPIQRFLHPALMLATLLITRPAFATAPVMPGVEVPPGEFNEALGALATLTTWRDQPPMYVELCDAVDPAGTPARRSLVDRWRTQHAADLDRIAGYEDRIAPVMYQIEGIHSADPGRQLRENSQARIRSQLSAKPHDEMLKKCTGFAGLMIFNEPVIAPIRNSAFATLDRWVAKQGAKR